jgi:hypothetical protein
LALDIFTRPLKAIYEWVSHYERTWNENLAALDDVLDEPKQKEKPNDRKRR